MGGLRCIQAVQDDRNFLPMLFRQYEVDQCSLASSQITSDKSQRDLGDREVLQLCTYGICHCRDTRVSHIHQARWFFIIHKHHYTSTFSNFSQLLLLAKQQTYHPHRQLVTHKMDSDAKAARAAATQDDSVDHRGTEECASETSTPNERSTPTCSWCSKPVTECSGQCLYKPLSVPPATASRKIYHKHIRPRVQVKVPGIDFSAMMAVSPSPSSSPRAPTSSPQAYSPPPAAEVQIGDPGPAIIEAEEHANLDHGATRRIRPGTRAADMASGPPLVPLNQVGPSAVIIFQVTPSRV